MPRTPRTTPRRRAPPPPAVWQRSTARCRCSPRSRAGDGALHAGGARRNIPGLYKSTALRLLASLDHARLLQRLADAPLPRWAARSARLHAPAASFSLHRVTRLVLRELVAFTGESAACHVRARANATPLCLARDDSPHLVRDPIRAGDLLPLGRGTGGRVLLAFDPELGQERQRGRPARVLAGTP